MNENDLPADVRARALNLLHQTEVLAARKPRKLTAKQRDKAIDAEVDRAFNKHCCNIQIPILKISDIFKAGHAAAAKGENIEDAVIAAVAAVRCDR